MDATPQQLQLFKKEIEEEILRRLRGESSIMSRDEIEEIGVKAGLTKLRTAGLFISLAGDVWAGHIFPTRENKQFWLNSPPKEPLPRWTGVKFHRHWFQQKGMLSGPSLGEVRPIERDASTIRKYTSLS
jgi:hypothetical protein